MYRLKICNVFHYLLESQNHLVNIDVLHLLAISLDLHGACIMPFCNPPLVLVHQVDHHLYILPVKKYMYIHTDK